MEYVDILSMVVDSDHNTTKDFLPLINDMPTDFFPDSNLLSETAICKSQHGQFVEVSKLDDIIVLKFLTDGKGSRKSCTKKVKLEFTPGLDEKLPLLKPNKPTDNIATDLHYQQLCMVATIYSVKRDSVDFNQTISKPQYLICYYLRKNNKNEFFLQSEIRNKHPKTYNNIQVNEFSIFNKIKPTFQRLLSNNYTSSTLTDFEEFDDIEELKNLYDFDDVDYDEDDLQELMDESEYKDDDLQDTDFLF